MRRFLGCLTLLVGLAFWLNSAHEAVGQSKKKLGGPTVEIEGLKSQVFEHWKEQKAAKPNTYAFLLPIDVKSDKDAAEMVVYPAEGTKEEIVAALKKSFEPPSFAKSIDEVTRSESFKAGKADVTAIYTQGTFLKQEGDSAGKVTKVENQRMRAYVFDVGGKKYVVRITGPFKSVGFHLPDSDAWAKAFK
ncbi:MAG: hypothetical protein JNM56_21220 [Planctomycetia bacterium]|nr:hypothetical protein [Planctomycetia bacterium]